MNSLLTSQLCVVPALSCTSCSSHSSDTARNTDELLSTTSFVANSSDVLQCPGTLGEGLLVIVIPTCSCGHLCRCTSYVLYQGLSIVVYWHLFLSFTRKKQVGPNGASGGLRMSLDVRLSLLCVVLCILWAPNWNELFETGHSPLRTLRTSSNRFFGLPLSSMR